MESVNDAEIKAAKNTFQIPSKTRLFETKKDLQLVGAQPFPISARISTLSEKKTENRPNNYLRTPQCIYLIIKKLNLTYAADKGDHDLQIDARLDYAV